MRTLAEDIELRKLTRAEWEDVVRLEREAIGHYAAEVGVTKQELAPLPNPARLSLVKLRAEEAKLAVLEQLEVRGLWRSEG